jgi:hypothetical protein
MPKPTASRANRRNPNSTAALLADTVADHDAAPPPAAPDSAPAVTVAVSAKPSALMLRRERAVTDAVYPAATVQARDLDYIAHIARAAILAHGNPYAAVSIADLHSAARPAIGNRQPQILFGNNPSAGASDAGALMRAERFGHAVRTLSADGNPVTVALCTVPDDIASVTDSNMLARCNAILSGIKRATPAA